jgi:hypothetical protein
MARLHPGNGDDARVSVSPSALAIHRGDRRDKGRGNIAKLLGVSPGRHAVCQ